MSEVRGRMIPAYGAHVTRCLFLVARYWLLPSVLSEQGITRITNNYSQIALVHCLLPTTYCLLPTAYLPTAYRFPVHRENCFKFFSMAPNAAGLAMETTFQKAFGLP